MSRTNTSKRHKEKEFNPALRIRDFYSFSLQILYEINYAREHPDEFVEKLKELRETVEESKDNCLYIENVPFVYNNLLGSLNDSIKFLEKQKELPSLTYNKTMTQACDYLLDELLAHDGLDDENANNYSLENRLHKFGYPLGENYELIDYGMFDPEFIVINFVLGDGDKNKFERNVIFNPKVKYIGIASGILSSEKICTIINFCEEFYEKNQNIPYEIEQKFNKTIPSFNTKTINNYSGKTGNSTNIERYTSNTKKEGNVEEQFTEEINTKRGDSGDVFSVKKTEYIKRRESIKDSNRDKDKNKKKDARIYLRNKKTKNEPKNMFDVFDDDEENFDEDDFFDKEFDINFGDNFDNKKKKSSKKVTTTKTTTDENGVKKTVVTTITEEIDGGVGTTKKDYFEPREKNDENKRNQKSRKDKVREREERERKKREQKEKEERELEEENERKELEREKERQKQREREREKEKEKEKEREREREIQRQKELEKQREYEKELEEKEKEKEREKREREKQENAKYKKKIIEIPIKLKPKREEKTEQYDDDTNNSFKYGTYKTVQDYPSHKRGFYEKDFEREEEIENEYPTDYREKKNTKFNISEDIYEKEEDMELPEGASSMQVKQKTITDSKGVPALIIKKTITYEDGSVKTIIEKKPINKK